MSSIKQEGRGKVDLTIFVPCYNEARLIAKTLDTIRAAIGRYSFVYEVLIYDDASTDHCPDLIREYIRANQLEGQFELVINERNAGIGVNYFRAAEKGRGEYFMIVFGDNSESAESLCKMFDLIGKADVVIPNIDSRFFDRGFNTDHRGFLRRMLSRNFARLVRLLSGVHVWYFNGFVMHRRQKVLDNRVDTYGLGYQAELLCKILSNPKVTFLEVRVSCESRSSGLPTAFKPRNIISVAASLWRIFCGRFENKDNTTVEPQKRKT